MSAAEIYAECLSHLKHGHPMYIPEPIVNANTAGHDFNQIDGVAIGDVGIIRSEGDFDFMFDVCDHASRSVRARGVQAAANAIDSNSVSVTTVDAQARGASRTAPEGHESIDAGEIRVNNNFLSSENPFLAYGREKTTDAGAGASVTFSEITAHLVPLEAGASWQFACSSHKGAITVAPQGAISIDAPQERRFLNCLDKIQTWFEYAENTRERTLENNSLTLVTGVVKCSTWSVAALLNSSSSSQGGNLSLSLTPAVRADASLSHSWSECQPAMCRSGPAQPRSGIRDQCLFIRGYRIMKQNFAERKIKKKVGVTNLRTDKSGYHKINEPRSRGFLGSLLGLPSKSETTQGDSNSQVSASTDDVEDDEDEEEYIVEKLSEAQMLYHPSDIINRYLLERVPEARFAITHDKDWWQLLKDTDHALPNDSELLDRLTCTYRFILKTGVVYLEKLDVTVVNPDLKRILSPVDAGFDRNGPADGPAAKCLDGTREEILAKIRRWIDDEDPDCRICWLNGPAGYGKSSISQTISEYCNSSNQMAASFFFARDAQHRSTIAHLVPTLAYQLSNSVPATRPFLQRALRSDLSILTKPLNHQFQKLMVEPILAVENSTLTPRTARVVVIDALDECSEKELMAESIELVINACLESRDFPFRFFLTSRLEEHLRKKLKASAAHSIVYPLDLRNFDASDDIRKFLWSHLFTIHEENQKLTGEIPRPWPSNSDIEALVEKAGGSFRYASESCRQRLSSLRSRITQRLLRPSSQQTFAGESSHVVSRRSISSISPIPLEPTQITAESSQHTSAIAGDAHAERLWAHTSEQAVSNKHSQAENCFTETTTLEGLIENLILPPVGDLEGHADEPAGLNNLGNSFGCRFQHSGDLVDIDKAISAHNQAVHLTPDVYRDTFLTTYTAFATTDEVFQSLVRRFCDAEASHPLHYTHLRINIINVMKYWMTTPYFKVDTNVLPRIIEFASSMQSSQPMNELAQELHSAAAKRLISPLIPHTPNSDRPTPPPTKPRDLAIALLMLEGDKYTRILPVDCISYFQQQPGENAVKDALELNRTITLWVQQSVLRCDGPEARREALSFFVYTAEESRKMHNFASMSAIVTALRSTTITRLKITIDRLPKNTTNMIVKMEAFMNPRDSRNAYVATLKGSKSPPCIPILDAHIADMRTAFSKARDAADVGGVPTINFAKWTEFHTCLKDVLRHRSPDVSQYREKTTAGVRAYLEHQLRGIRIGSMTDEGLEERSIMLEQREKIYYQDQLSSVGM